MGNTLIDLYPDLAEEWYDVRDILEISPNSHYNAQWKCNNGHIWKSVVSNRTRQKSKCPYCSGRRAIVGHNDLSTTHPHLVKEWDDKRFIHEFTANSGYRAQWKCKVGHTWRTKIYHKAVNKSNCPYCSGRKVLSGYNDLTTTHPELVREWNDDRSASTVSSGSKYRALWRCATDSTHIWTASVSSRSRGSRCPYCTGRKAIKNITDLATTNPELIIEWDDSREISEFSQGSEYNARWKCQDYQHTYYSTIYNRVYRKRDCSYCSGRKTLKGFNDLATIRPDLITEWDDIRDASSITVGSNYRAKWKCENGHTWEAIVNNRTREKSPSNCPSCTSPVSAAEQELHDFVTSILPENTIIEQSNRGLIGKELDIYIPDYNIAIEYNGLYWHTEAQGRDRWYHYNKYNDCRKKNVKLITVWEDLWRDNPSAVRNMISHKLKAASAGTVYARKTVFSKLSTSEAIPFLNKHHLQGGNMSSKHYGLKDKKTNELVAVMSIRHAKTKKELEIKRFATSKSVPGGFSKLLKNIIAEHKKDNTVSTLFGSKGDVAERIVSYSHNDHSWGEVYAKNGFTKIHDGEPGYFYLRNGNREFRLNYSPKRFREREDLIFEEGKTERELAKMNGLERIWDCGSARWEKIISS